MKVGDLVKVIQPGRGFLSTPFAGEIGVIIHKQLGMMKEEDNYSVLARDRIFVIGSCYLELIDKREKEK